MLTIRNKVCAGALALTSVLVACGPAGAETLGVGISSGDKVAVVDGGSTGGAVFGGVFTGGNVAATNGALAATPVGYDRYDSRYGYYDRWGVFHYYERYYRRDWDDRRFRHDFDDRRFRDRDDRRFRHDRDDRHRR